MNATALISVCAMISGFVRSDGPPGPVAAAVSDQPRKAVR